MVSGTLSSRRTRYSHVHARCAPERRAHNARLAAQLGPADLRARVERFEQRLVAEDDGRMAGGMGRIGMARRVLRWSAARLNRWRAQGR